MSRKPKLKTKTGIFVEVHDWDDFVQKVYGRTYNFQQQNDCQDRGIYELDVPSDFACDFERDAIPEKVNGSIMGVSLKAWLERDPKQKIQGQTEDYELDLFWERNFYPNIEMLANDLHEKGLLEAGDYKINIDW